MTEKDIFRVGMCLNHVALGLSDESFNRVRPWLQEIEDIVKKYSKRGGMNTNEEKEKDKGKQDSDVGGNNDNANGSTWESNLERALRNMVQPADGEDSGL